ncbi:MAG: hypothetical protein RIF32_10525, partial [Leptospirales bacterium]
MRRFAFLLRACVLMALTLAVARPLGSQADSDAPRYLRQAILEFQAGRPQRARDYLSAARGLNREGIQADPAARKLSGF